MLWEDSDSDGEDACLGGLPGVFEAVATLRERSRTAIARGALNGSLDGEWSSAMDMTRLRCVRKRHRWPGVPQPLPPRSAGARRAACEGRGMCHMRPRAPPQRVRSPNVRLRPSSLVPSCLPRLPLECQSLSSSADTPGGRAESEAATPSSSQATADAEQFWPVSSSPSSRVPLDSQECTQAGKGAASGGSRAAANAAAWPSVAVASSSDGALGGEGSVLLEGWLYKRGQTVENWKRRYCVLRRGGRFLYFGMVRMLRSGQSEPHQGSLKGEVLLRRSSEVAFEAAPSGRRALAELPDKVFALRFGVGKGRTMHLCASTEAQRVTWVHALRASVAELRDAYIPGSAGLMHARGAVGAASARFGRDPAIAAQAGAARAIRQEGWLAKSAVLKEARQVECAMASASAAAGVQLSPGSSPPLAAPWRRFNRRYFVLHGGCLHYYVDRTCAALKGVIDLTKGLEQSPVVATPPRAAAALGATHCFAVMVRVLETSPGDSGGVGCRAVLLGCSSLEEAHTWRRAIEIEATAGSIIDGDGGGGRSRSDSADSDWLRADWLRTQASSSATKNDGRATPSPAARGESKRRGTVFDVPQGVSLISRVRSRSQAEAAAAAVTHCGWLLKRGKMATSWRRRWFVLENRVLTYYTSSNCIERRGELSLAGAVATLSDSLFAATEEFPQQLAIVAPMRTLYLAARSQANAVEWRSAVRRATMDEALAGKVAAYNSYVDQFNESIVL